MNKKVFLFLIVFNLINCEYIKFAVTKVIKDGVETPTNFIFDFRPNDSTISKDFVNKLKNQSPISVTFSTQIAFNNGYIIAHADVNRFPIELNWGNMEEGSNTSRGEFIYTRSGGAGFYSMAGYVAGFVFGSIDLSDSSLMSFLDEKLPNSIVTSFYIAIEIGLKIENCLDPNEDYEIYEMGIIINNEFYDLEHEQNCSWKIILEKKDDILSFKTLLFSSDTSNKRPLRKTFNLNELEGSGTINECIYNKTDNFTLLLNC